MVTRQKKRFLYAITFAFSFVVAMLGIQRDRQNDYTLSWHVSAPLVSADVPVTPTDGTTGDDDDGGDTTGGDFYPSDSGSGGCDGDCSEHGDAMGDDDDDDDDDYDG